MITLLFVLELFLYIYLAIAFVVFLNFIIRPFTMTMTNKLTNKKEEVHGFRKIKWYLFFSLLWPMTFYLSEGE